MERSHNVGVEGNAERRAVNFRTGKGFFFRPFGDPSHRILIASSENYRLFFASTAICIPVDACVEEKRPIIDECGAEEEIF